MCYEDVCRFALASGSGFLVSVIGFVVFAGVWWENGFFFARGRALCIGRAGFEKGMGYGEFGFGRLGMQCENMVDLIDMDTLSCI